MKDRVLTRIRMATREQGGLLTPLKTPTPSLQFRTADEDLLYALVAVIYLPGDADLEAGQIWDDALVQFPIEGTEPFIQHGRTFDLWNARTVGTAEIIDRGL